MTADWWKWWKKTDVNATKQDVDEQVLHLLDFLKKQMQAKCDKCKSRLEGCKSGDYELIRLAEKKMYTQYPFEMHLVSQERVLSSDQPEVVLAVAIGLSMYPTINQGDILLICGYSSLQVGDIVSAYFTDGAKKCSIIHRIVGVEDHFVYLSGDNSQGDIQKVHRFCVAGKVSLIIKREQHPELYDILIKAIGDVKKEAQQ